MSADDGPDPPDEESRAPKDALRRVANAETGALMVVREAALSVGAVVAVGALLFAISGVWPPMVAVESGSMEPHMHRGDLVFMTEPGRFAAEAAHGETGVVTRRTGREVGHWKFGGHGSVIVYDEPGESGPPVIHRAQFWVEAGENWYDRADTDAVSATNCTELLNCPAPHAGFVTKGDNNRLYDQANGISEPVKPAWVVGVARVRIPYLGWIRLSVSENVLQTVVVTERGSPRRSSAGPGGPGGPGGPAMGPMGATNANDPVGVRLDDDIGVRGAVRHRAAVRDATPVRTRGAVRPRMGVRTRAATRYGPV